MQFRFIITSIINMSNTEITDEKRIKVEVELENNAATWLRQMVTTISITIAVLAYFELRGDIKKSPVAIFSIIILLLTSITIGVMSSLAYHRRKKVLIKEGILTDSVANKWYMYVGFASVIGFVGIGIAVILNKTNGNK